MALFDSAMQAAVKAVSDSSSEGYQSPYEDSYYYNPTGGTDADFLAYLKRLQAERKGGILGGGMFGSMGEAEKKTADVNASDVLGDLIQKQTSSGSSSGGSGVVPTGPRYDSAYDRNGNGVLEPDELRAMTLAEALERQTGRAMLPSGVLGIAGPAGMLLGAGADALVSAADNKVIADALREAGFSEDQIEAMSAEQALDMMAKGNIGTYSYGKPTGDQVGAIGAGEGDNLIEAGLNLFRPQQSNPFVAMPNLPQSYRDVINPNYNPATGLFAVPTVANMAGAFDTGSLGRAAAQQRIDAIEAQRQAEEQRKAAAARVAAARKAEQDRVAAAAAEASRLSAAQRQARLASTTSSISGGGTDGSSIGWSSPSSSVSSGRTSSSDISYSASRDYSSTTGYDFNKD